MTNATQHIVGLQTVSTVVHGRVYMQEYVYAMSSSSNFKISNELLVVIFPLDLFVGMFAIWLTVS